MSRSLLIAALAFASSACGPLTGIGTTAAVVVAARRDSGHSPLPQAFVRADAVPVPFLGQLVVGDLKGDARPEVVIGFEGLVRVYEITGATGSADVAFTLLQEIDLLANPGQAPAIADLNADGRADVIASGRVLLNQTAPGGALTFAAPQQLGVAVDRFADINADGRIDLVASGTVRLNETPTATSQIAFGQGTPYSFSFSSPITTDLDGNGTIDVVAPSSTTRHLNLNSTPPGATQAILTRVTSVVPADSVLFLLAAADMNDDGRIDLCGFDIGNLFGVLLNLGVTASGAELEEVRVPLDGFIPRGAVDMNADGRPDVVAINGFVNTSSTTFVYLVNATPSGSRQISLLPPVGLEVGGLLHDRALVDINGDGRRDAVLLMRESQQQTKLVALVNITRD